MAVMQPRELSVPEAQSWFGDMPRQQRLCSLSPAFAHADTQRMSGLQCRHIGIGQGSDRWLHSLHLKEVVGHGLAAIAPYGYGGPLSSCAEPAFLADAWTAYSGWAAQQRVIGEFCRFHPEAMHEAFFGGQVRANRATISVDLTVSPVESQFSQLARRKIRRAGALPVRWSRDPADWRRFGPFYRQAMAAIGAQQRYHFSDAYFEAISSVAGVALCLCGPDDRWSSAGAYLFQQREPQDEGIGGTVEYHLGASSPEGHAGGTAYLMQLAAALEGQRLGLASLYLGGGLTPDPGDPLLFYKRAFSRRERTFHVGNAIHHPALYGEFTGSRGYHPANAPPNLLFD